MNETTDPGPSVPIADTQSLTELAEGGVQDIVVLPTMLPMEPGFPAWITRAVHRWKAQHTGHLPEARVTEAPASQIEDLADILARLASTPGDELTGKQVTVEAIGQRGRSRLQDER